MPGDFGDSTSGRYDGYGQVDPLAPSVANGQITPAQWAEYQRRRRQAAILGTLGTIGGMLGGGALSYALGGGGAAAGSASVPGAVGAEAAPLGTGSVVAGGALPSGAGISAATVGSGTAAGAGAGVGAGATAKGLIGGLTARDLAALGLSGASVIGSMTQDKPNLAPTTATTDPNFLKLIQTMQGRLDKSEPLYDSILSMANGLLPTQYQKGGGGMG